MYLTRLIDHNEIPYLTLYNGWIMKWFSIQYLNLLLVNGSSHLLIVILFGLRNVSTIDSGVHSPQRLVFLTINNIPS
jgi:hypothetical protein